MGDDVQLIRFFKSESDSESIGPKFTMKTDCSSRTVSFNITTQRLCVLVAAFYVTVILLTIGTTVVTVHIIKVTVGRVGPNSAQMQHETATHVFHNKIDDENQNKTQVPYIVSGRQTNCSQSETKTDEICQGIKGETGDKGLKGDTGDKGPEGSKGETGSDGQKGNNGEKGIKGDKGQTGEKGQEGNKGPIGDKGLIGEKGSRGEVGLKGERGDKGMIGIQGNPGINGTDGEEGQIGEKGQPGEKGLQGQKGEKGQSGVVGQQGLVGESGEKGVKGELGAKGLPGEKGLQGDKGLAATERQCGAGWELFGKYCYYFKKSKSTWSEAKTLCQSQGGSLVEIENAVENWFIKSILKDLQIGSSWIGANDLDKEGEMIWISNRTPVKNGFTDWVPGEPNNSGRQEHCAMMWDSRDYRWNDAPCSFKSGYACKK